MTGRVFMTLVAGAMFIAAIWIGVAQYHQAKQEEQFSRQAAANVRAIGEGVVAYTDERIQEVERTPRARDNETGELAAFEFLVGTWRGEKDGGLVEEIWSKPEGGAMMGMFRWLNAEGRSRMYELLTISREDEQTFLRLRHFTPAMVAWEEKDAPIVMKLTDSFSDRVVFENIAEENHLERIVFHQPEAGELTIDVEFRAGSGRQPLNFRFQAIHDAPDR